MSRVNEILRLLEEGATQTEIARILKISRRTVGRYVKKANKIELSAREAKELPDEELKEIFEIQQPGPKSYKELDYEAIDRELLTPGVTRTLLYKEYCATTSTPLSYSRFCANLSKWQQRKKVTFRKEYQAGKTMQVDYAGPTVPIYCAETQEVLFHAQIFVATLCASNKLYVEASRSQKLECWIGAHCRALEYFGGVPRTIVPDNLKSAVTKACRYDPELNKSYTEFATHYGVVVMPARPGKPQDKAKVESAVRFVEQQILAALRKERFYTLNQLNNAIAPLREQCNEQEMSAYGCSRNELFKEVEEAHLEPLPQQSFAFRRFKKAVVHIDYHITLDGCHYSVPYQYARETVELRYTDSTVRIYHQNKEIAVHPRIYKKNKYSTLKDHMPPSHRHYAEWNATRFLEWAADIGPETAIQVNSLLLQQVVLEHGYRKCMGLLGCAKKFGKERLEAACKRANELGIVSQKSIRSMLQKNLESLDNRVPEQMSCAVHGNIRGDTAFH